MSIDAASQHQKHAAKPGPATSSEASVPLDRPQSRELPPRPTARTFGLAFGIAAVTVIAFAPSLRNEFVEWDDPGLILDNPNIRRLGFDQLRWMFTSFHMGPYQPLPWLSLAVDYHFWGLDPLGYHLSGLIWHAANAVLLFVVARQLLRLAIPSSAVPLTQLEIGAAIAAVVFAVHPLRVESVVWAAERRDVMCGFFVLATMWAYGNAVSAQPSRRRYRRWIGCSQFMFLLSLLCKATGMLLPAVLTILDIYPLRRLSWSGKRLDRSESAAVWLEKIPFWIMGLAGATAALYGQRTTGAMTPIEVYGPLDRLAIASFASFFYVQKTLLPVRLSPFYEIPPNFHAWQLRFILPGIASLVLTGLALYGSKRRPAVLAAWLSYLFLLAPVSGLAQTGGQLAADRYSYLSCLGFALLAGGMAIRYVQIRTATWQVLGLLLVCGLAAQTWRQSQVWHDTTTLWNHALAIDPQSSIAYNNAAKAPIRENRLVDAARLLQKALQLRPKNADAHNNMGVVLRRLGAPYEAMEHYNAALGLQPRSPEFLYNSALLLAEEPLLTGLGFSSLDEQRRAALERYQQALEVRPHDAKTLNDVGILYKKIGQMDRAVEFYKAAIEAEPDYVNPHYNLAIALSDQGRDDEGAAEYHRVLELEPHHAGASNNLARILERAGNYRAAAQLLRTSLDHSPYQPVLLFHLSWLLATAPDASVRSGPEALQLAERLRAISDERNPRTIDALAAAYAEVGRFDEAVATESLACRIAHEQDETTLEAEFEQRLDLYRAGRPFRSP